MFVIEAGTVCVMELFSGLVFVSFAGRVMEVARAETKRADFALSFSGCGELTRRPGLSEGGTGLSLAIHHHGKTTAARVTRNIQMFLLVI